MRKAVTLADLTWQQLVVEGACPEALCGRTDDAATIWPLVEEKLGYGIGRRRARFMLHDQGARQQKPMLFFPPEWWTIHSVQEAAQSLDERGELTGEWVYRDAKPRKDGGVLIRLGWVTIIDATIDGVEVGIPEAVWYALTWAERQPRSAWG